MLKQLIAEKWITANAVVGFWPANSVGDDIDSIPMRAAERRSPRCIRCASRWHATAASANLALADFIAPKELGVADYIGGFAVTAGIGEEVVARRFERANDDYSKIMVKALADRLAEAFAEEMHEKVRREFWGYAPDETLSNEPLITEEYAGIRPAAGYPAQPDHTEKRTLFKLLDAETPGAGWSSRARPAASGSTTATPTTRSRSPATSRPAARGRRRGPAGRRLPAPPRLPDPDLRPPDGRRRWAPPTRSSCSTSTSPARTPTPT